MKVYNDDSDRGRDEKRARYDGEDADAVEDYPALEEGRDEHGDLSRCG